MDAQHELVANMLAGLSMAQRRTVLEQQLVTEEMAQIVRCVVRGCHVGLCDRFFYRLIIFC